MAGCRKFRDAAALYAAGALDPGERRAFADHLLGCPSCRNELESWKDFLQEVTQAGSVPSPSPREAAWAVARLLRRLEEEGSDAGRKSRAGVSLGRGGRVWAAAAACALALLLFLGGVLWHHSETMRPVAIRTAQERVLPPEERELIERLDLLRDLETIEKLVRSVDGERDKGESRSVPGSRQGFRQRNERKTGHA
ncbi:MAG: zf-HC2 domain-containing protein [Desulfacinum sp.]|nr:zf-HC2 domain-containing protein [Desulfacinum sp.]